jgi:cyclomaltodextrinase / maltogenic alpha-amylase / neopullulanase
VNVKHRFELRLSEEEDDTSSITRVDLFGEVCDWRNPIALRRVDDRDAIASGGWDAVSFETTIDLPPGVYQYKFLVTRLWDETAWMLDPRCTRTRSSNGGQKNSLVVIDGAPEPWLFAPAAPWILELERGGARVLAGMRKSPPSSPAEGVVAAADGLAVPSSARHSSHFDHRLSWSEDDGATWSSTRLEHAFDEDEHSFFVATIPVSAPTVRIALESLVPGAVRFETTWSRPKAVDRVPIWWKRAIIYGIFVDRFRPREDSAEWERDPGRRIAAGGHLAGIERSLDELVELGVDTLYLTPVHVGASAHRYDLVDPLKIDPALGGEAAYGSLVRAARTRGMRIIQDISFAHVGRGFPPWLDVEEHGEKSRFASWFQWKDGKLVHYGKRTDAPLLDQTNLEVQAMALETVAYWAKRGVSGLRLDMTAEVPLDLGRAIRRKFRELVRDGVVFGEVVPEHAWRWRNEGVIDAATDFGFHETVTSLVCAPANELDASAAFQRLARTDLLRGGDPRLHSVRFLSTHDHARLASLAFVKGTTDRLPLAYMLLATLPGVPMLLYGEELGLRSTDTNRAPEDVWPDRMPMPWMTAALRDPLTLATMRALLKARRESEALRSGGLQLLFADATTLVYRRALDREIIDVALNFSNEPKTIELEDDEHPRLDAIFSIGGALATSNASMSMPPCSAIVARRERALGRAVTPVLARRNLALRDRDMVVGASIATGRPTRFLFSVTEQCNLRCEHCITHAPEKTKSGTARTMTGAVLDALVKDFGLADYFAFVHGGESLTAPIFFDVLDAIKAERGSEPYVAHLLTNGVMLDLKTAEKLVRGGVSSISISLDGATAATNDAIRTGGRFFDVRENLRRLIRWRTEEGIDLRVGVSSVVLKQNIAELSELVDLGADLGVDWIKLEEGVPATSFAKRSLVAMTAPNIRAEIERALVQGRSRGLVMIDHTIERTIWRCRLDEDEEGRKFLEADEMANRTIIHPCRIPWETVCVEPNGDIRARDFYGPILGNVTTKPLTDLWNEQSARDLRRDASLTRLCAPSGPVVCVPSLV